MCRVCRAFWHTNLLFAFARIAAGRAMLPSRDRDEHAFRRRQQPLADSSRSRARCDLQCRGWSQRQTLAVRSTFSVLDGLVGLFLNYPMHDTSCQAHQRKIQATEHESTARQPSEGIESLPTGLLGRRFTGDDVKICSGTSHLTRFMIMVTIPVLAFIGVVDSLHVSHQDRSRLSTGRSWCASKFSPGMLVNRTGTAD